MSRSAPGLFVVGTDTGVGKTFVARALCRAARLRGASVVGLKPYESGCTPRPEDAEALEREAHSGLPLEARCPFRYRAPVAPAVAAQKLGRRAPVARAAALVRQVSRGRFAIVEGAGGLASPLSGRETNLTLARALKLPVVLVARDALGTLSHVSLAVAALRAAGIEPWAIVLSRGLGPRDASQPTNLAWIEKLTGVRAVALPRLGLPRAAKALAHLARG